MRSRRVEIFLKIYKYLRAQKDQYYIYAILSFGNAALDLAEPLFYGILINDIMLYKRNERMVIVVAGYIMIYAIKTIEIALSTKYSNKLFGVLKFKMRSRMLQNVMKMSYENIDTYNCSDLKISIDSDVDLIEKFLKTHIVEYAQSVISILALSAIMLALNRKLAIIGIIAVPISFAISKMMGEKLRKSSEEYRYLYARYENYLQNAIKNWKEVKARCAEGEQIIGFRRYWDQLYILFIRRQKYWFVNRGVVAFKDLFITKMNLYFIGGILIVYGELDVGLLLVFMNYYAQMFASIVKVTETIVGIRDDYPSLNKVINLIEADEPEVYFTNTNRDKTIAITNASMFYARSNKPALSKINLEIRNGEKVTIVGRSGSGKTSLIKMMLGMCKPKEGSVKIGGCDVHKIDKGTMRQTICAVMQDTYFFNLSIRENLTVVKESAKQEQIDNACKTACIYDFVQSLSEKYDTKIGENGVVLSGGQKQRLALARVLLIDPSIIIFDEATSSLDNYTEEKLISSVRALLADKTLITIAHRKSSIMKSDRIIVIDDGRIVGDGYHDDLLRENECYKALYYQFEMKSRYEDYYK